MLYGRAKINIRETSSERSVAQLYRKLRVYSSGGVMRGVVAGEVKTNVKYHKADQKANIKG